MHTGGQRYATIDSIYRTTIDKNFIFYKILEMIN